ncbi:YmdB family metallophosphoesterase, partial [Staphylococcus aureus]|nr:YmdB family metallophosphoesterase [Staphylococcus aureus]
FYDGILGRNKTDVIERFITCLPQRHVVPIEGRSVLSGVVFDLDKEGKTKQIVRILINDDHPFSTFYNYVSKHSNWTL